MPANNHSKAFAGLFQALKENSADKPVIQNHPRKIVSIFIGLVVTAVLGFLCYTSIGYLQLFMRTGRTTAVLNLPFTWIYIIVPVSCMLQIFNYFLVNVFGYEDEVEKLVEEDEDE